MNKLVVLINGSRDFNNYLFLESECYKILSPYIEKEYGMTKKEAI